MSGKALDIIKEIVTTSGDLAAALEHPSLAMRMGVHISRDYLDEKRWRAKQRSLYRLVESGHVVSEKTAKGLAYALTHKGAVEYLRKQVNDAEMMSGDDICMVIFDIPEKHRSLRRDLFAFLVDAGFVPYQKSVFISPFNAFDALAQLFALKNADEWVKVYRSTRVLPKGRSAVRRRK